MLSAPSADRTLLGLGFEAGSEIGGDQAFKVTHHNFPTDRAAIARIQRGGRVWT
jgi:hypothetical protein